MIPYGRQDITEADIQAVVDVMRSEFLTQGPVVPKFEKAVACKVGAKYAVASNSGTSSLHLACRALGVGPGDWVWTSPITFVASANCARYCGADVDFVDIDRKYRNLSVEKLTNKLQQAEQEGKLPKVVIPVHLAGHPADMAEIRKLSKKYGFYVIEDASHALAGSYRGVPIGSCQFSDVTVFSFHPVKIVTSAEGGIAATNDPEIAQRIALLNSHGITREPSIFTRESDGPWYYEQLDLGFNYRMTELQGALGLSQIKRVDQYIARRHELAARYDTLLADLPMELPARDPRDYSAFHLYIVRLNTKEISSSHREIFERLRAAGVLVNLHYIPIYRQPYYIDLGFDLQNFPEAESYYTEAISLPLHPRLTEGDQDYVVSCIRREILQ
ncbi:MAG: UDP-4-amino-4,6-dideoxy-N-acetyl-beta-L-altrosamine transaminase [Hyphomicrobiaceae bacterium]